MIRSNSARLFQAFTLLLLALLLFGCSEKVVSVGVVVPLTGGDSSYGEVIRRGIEIAYDEIKADPAYKVPLQITIADSGSDPAHARDLLKEQFDDGAYAVIGGVTSDEVIAMLEEVDRYDRVLLSPSASSPELSGISRNFYRIIPSDYTAATKMADFAIRTLEAKTAVVISEERTFSRGIQSVFQPAFEDQGGKVIEAIEIPANMADVGGLMDRVVTLNPDVVYLVAYEDGVIAMIEELRRLDYQGRILTTSAFAKSSAIARTGEKAVGVLLTRALFDLDSPHAHIQKFIKAYQAKYNELPDIYAAYGYDAMKVMADALIDHDALPSDLPKGLRDNIKEHPGITGAITFNEKGDVTKYPRVYLISEDLTLFDYNEMARQKQEEIRAKREELQRQLEEIQRKAKEMGG